MVADSGARMVIADAGTVGTVRDAVALVAHALAGEYDVDADLLSRAVVPRVVVDRRRAVGGGAVLRRPADAAAPAPALPLPGPGAAGRAPLHQRRRPAARAPRCSATGRCSPTSSRSPSVEPPMIHGDDVVLGRAAALPRLRAQRGAGRRAAAPGHAGARRPASTRRAPSTVIEDEAVQRGPGRAAGLRPLAGRSTGPARAARPGAADAVGVGAALGRAAGRASPSAPASRSTRATGSPRPPRSSPAPCAASAVQPGSVGAALPGIDLRLVDECGPRRRTARTPGRSRSAATNLFSGYWPDGSDGPDADGWWATGDVGFIDAAGDLFLVDRLKDLVIVSGFNVYPVEVEDVIREVDGGRRGRRDRRRGRRDR